MNRRDSLKLLGASAMAMPLPTLAGTKQARVVFDGRLARCRHFARTASESFDCGEDMAVLWFTALAPRLPDLLPLEGLTGQA